MDRIKKIINYITWAMIAVTGILFFANWNNIPESVITHIGLGVSYGSRNNLILLFIIEIIIMLLIEITPIINIILLIALKSSTSFSI